jgi:hypothetical protein
MRRDDAAVGRALLRQSEAGACADIDAAVIRMKGCRSVLPERVRFSILLFK